LYGAVAGAVLVNYAKTYFTGALPEVWLYALGLLFVLATLFLPRGLAGLFGRFRDAGQAGLAGMSSRGGLALTAEQSGLPAGAAKADQPVGGTGR
jgi:hypothetical protein